MYVYLKRVNIGRPNNIQMIIYLALPTDRVEQNLVGVIHCLLDIGVRSHFRDCSSVNRFNYLWTCHPLREDQIQLMARWADFGIIFDLRTSMTPYMKQNLQLTTSKNDECMIMDLFKHSVL